MVVFDLLKTLSISTYLEIVTNKSANNATHFDFMADKTTMQCVVNQPNVGLSPYDNIYNSRSHVELHVLEVFHI